MTSDTLTSKKCNSRMPTPTNRWRLISLLCFLPAVFWLRFWFGASCRLWYVDEIQIYLIGLKFYTTHFWPYWGPDWIVPPSTVVAMQIPGALQGLVAGLPFFVKPVPEAPQVFVNLLSLSSLSLLAWYCTRRLPEVPAWIVWIWLMTAPWSMYVSTRVYNPAYALTGSVLFFVGFLEVLSYTSRQSISPTIVPIISPITSPTISPITSPVISPMISPIIPPNRAAFLMGFGLCWIMQFHLSWVALAPLAPAALYSRKRAGKPVLGACFAFALGCLIPCCFLLPTYLKFGIHAGMSGAGKTISLGTLRHPGRSIATLAAVVVHFLSFASFDPPVFLREQMQAHFEFFRGRLWLLPFFFFPLAVGFLQPVALLLLWFRKRGTDRGAAPGTHDDWPAIKYVTLATTAITGLLFLFFSADASPHAFYVLFPLAMIYSFYCWSGYLQSRGWQVFAGIFLLCGIFFHATLAFESKSWLSERRDGIEAALQAKDYHLVGERRPGARY